MLMKKAISGFDTLFIPFLDINNNDNSITGYAAPLYQECQPLWQSNWHYMSLFIAPCRWHQILLKIMRAS